MYRILGVPLALLLSATLAPADEGMWPYNHLPLEQLREKYGFEADSEFFENLQLASVRFNNGGSGSFVSPRGLAMTNHHVASDCIKKLSSETKDYLKDGFYAPRQSAELKCPDLELNVLLSIETVTSRVNENVTPEMSEKERLDAQKAATADIEKDCRDSTLNRCRGVWPSVSRRRSGSVLSICSATNAPGSASRRAPSPVRHRSCSSRQKQAQAPSSFDQSQSRRDDHGTTQTRLDLAHIRWPVRCARRCPTHRTVGRLEPVRMGAAGRAAAARRWHRGVGNCLGAPLVDEVAQDRSEHGQGEAPEDGREK